MCGIDPDNLLQYRDRLNEAGEYLCSRTNDPEARKAYIAVLYVQSSLLADAGEMNLAALSSAEHEMTQPKEQSGDGTHDWFFPEFCGWECCRVCGIVRRADRKNRPCKGPTSLTLKAREHGK